MQLCESSNFTIKSIGKQKCTVYDIEVKDNHNFFGNNILVHNSNYLSLEEVIDKMGIVFDNNEAFDTWMRDFVEDVIQPEINRALEEYAFQFGVPNIIKFGYEKIIYSMFVTGGKNYALAMIRDDDDTFFDEPKVKVTGIPIKKKTALEISKKHMSVVLDMILKGTTREAVMTYMRPVKEEFFSITLEDIAKPGMVNNYSKYAYTVKELKKDGIRYKTKAPARNKAVQNYNYVIDLEGLNRCNPIDDATMCKYAECNPNNKYGFEVIAWEDKFPPEFSNLFEADLFAAWETGFMNLLKKWFETLGWGIPKFEEDSIQDFMGF